MANELVIRLIWPRWWRVALSLLATCARLGVPLPYALLLSWLAHTVRVECA